MTINLDEFSIINGKKYKKCKSNQIRNPNTNRCNKIKIVKKSKTFINLKAKNLDSKKNFKDKIKIKQAKQ